MEKFCFVIRSVIKLSKTKQIKQMLFESVEERNETVEAFNDVVGLN